MHSRQLLRALKIACKQEKVKELKEKHEHCEVFDMSVTEIRTSGSEGD